ncbi:MAG: hypothetical protein ACFWT6_00280 [Virgibacillus proomii]|jgi:hypothetical protein
MSIKELENKLLAALEFYREEIEYMNETFY